MVSHAPHSPHTPRPRRARLRAMIAAAAGLATVTAGLTVPAVASADSATPLDLARYGTITADKVQNDPGQQNGGYFPASNAIDGDDSTRWASGNGTDSATASYTATLTEDLGAPATFGSLQIKWEAAFAAGYDIQVASQDPAASTSWTQVYATTAGTGGTENITLPNGPVDARYIRLDMTSRTSISGHYYGYSIYTFSVFGAFDTPQVDFANTAISATAGDNVSVPLVLTGPAASDQTVHVRSTGGTATAGTDYSPVDQDVTIPAGQTTAHVTVPTVDEGPFAPQHTVQLALSSASSGIAVGSVNTATVTVAPHGTPTDIGTTNTISDFEDPNFGNGSGDYYSGWGSSSALTPALAAVADSGPPGSPDGNHVLVATSTGTPTSSSWYGFTYEPKNAGGADVPQDWSDYDGFSFWFDGTNSGKTFQFELHNRDASNTEVAFDQSVTDNFTGWRKITVLFSALRLKNNHSSPTRFIASKSTGFAVTLTGFASAGAWKFDDFALFTRVSLLDDFESPITTGSPSPYTPGYFAYHDAESSATAAVAQQDREGATANPNHALAGTYDVDANGGAGLTDDVKYAQDWSSYRGIQFWWHASESAPPDAAPPTLQFEIKDGGTDGEHAENWVATFKDTWGSDTTPWELVQLPFSAFTLADKQPEANNAAVDNGTLDLTGTTGWSVLFPATTSPRGYSIDDVALYGTPEQLGDISVTAPDVTQVDAGGTATVALTLTTASGKPTGAPVTVTWSTGAGSAQAGTDYTAANGAVTFPAGSNSGDRQTVQVATANAHPDGSEALTIPLTLTDPSIQLPSAAPRIVINAHGLPYLNTKLPIADRVTDLLGRMSLAEKVGQMAQAERASISDPQQITRLGLGSILSGGGSWPAADDPNAWAAMIDAYQSEAMATPLQIPLLYGADVVHGHSNLQGATIYPHNIGLGATRDPALVQTIGQQTAVEAKTTGVNWAFAPCLCVSRDERWGRTYESYGEDPSLVSSFGAAIVNGLQGTNPSDKSGPGKVLATAKHWVGDGGTAYGTGSGSYTIDQGVTEVSSKDQLEQLYATPYVPAISAGVGSIMPSYSGVSYDGGKTVTRMSEDTDLDTNLLKGTMNFSGFLISDYSAIDDLPASPGLSGSAAYDDKVVRSINAGMDMAMEPGNYATFISSLEKSVQNGLVSQDRINDAVSRILTQKFELGLFDSPTAAYTDTSDRDQFGDAAHRATAADAAAESQVLLKNTDNALPLASAGKLYVAGSNADNLGNQMGGWTITWQGASGTTTTGGTTVLKGIQNEAPNLHVTYSKDASASTSGYDEGLVVVGETPYAEGQGDVGVNGHTLNLSAADTKAVNTVCAAMKCVVLVISGRPQMLSGIASEAQGIVAGFLPGSEGEGVADVLLGKKPFTGRLPLSWPASMGQIPVNVGDANYNAEYPYGWGLRTDAPKARLTALLPQLSGAAKQDVQDLVDAHVWNSDGTVSSPQHALQLAETAAAALSQTVQAEVDTRSVAQAQAEPLDTTELAQADTVVSIARDLAQRAIVAEGPTPAQADVAATADAEHDLESGDAADAVRLLARVAGNNVTVRVPALVATVNPTVSGKAVVGAQLTASSGTWSQSYGVSYAYQWLADGKAVAGATGTTFTPTAAQLGDRITVTVTASKTGYQDGTATAAQTAPVAPAGSSASGGH